MSWEWRVCCVPCRMNLQMPGFVSVQLTTVLGYIPYYGGFSFHMMTPHTERANFSVLIAVWFLVN
jgi:hypothetical protein